MKNNPNVSCEKFDIRNSTTFFEVKSKNFNSTSYFLQDKPIDKK